MRSTRTRVAVLVGVILPLVTGLGWICAGRPLTGAVGLAVAVLVAHLQHRRGLLRVRRPTFGDPNKRRPIIIHKLRWPNG